MVGTTIRNARLVLPEGIVRGELAIEEGRICEIAVSGLPKASNEINAEDKIVMPGVVGTNTHLHDIHHLPREDFRNGSAAAAAGGVTCVITTPFDTSMLTARETKKIIEVGCKEKPHRFRATYWKHDRQLRRGHP